MKKIGFAVLVLLISCTFFVDAQRRTTTRRSLKASDDAISQIHRQSDLYKTVACTKGDVIVSGYDKPTRSTCESAFFTNNTPHHIEAIILTVNYTDMSGRKLHNLQTTISGTISPNDTRHLSWPSWDKQQSFHYYLSRKVKRGVTTPYQVTCTVDSIKILSSEK